MNLSLLADKFADVKPTLDVLNEDALQLPAESIEKLNNTLERIFSLNLDTERFKKYLDYFVDTNKTYIDQEKLKELTAQHIVSECKHGYIDLGVVFKLISDWAFNSSQLKLMERTLYSYALTAVNKIEKNPENFAFLLNSIEEGIWKLPPQFSRGAWNRLLHRLKPRASVLSDKETAPGYNDIINHVSIISLLSRKQFEWAKLKDIISRCTPAAKNLIRRVIFSDYGKEFIFDETMQPMDASLDPVSISDNTLVHMKDITYEPNLWAPVFADFKIIPIFDYFNTQK